jgi:hypothetical protein
MVATTSVVSKLEKKLKAEVTSCNIRVRGNMVKVCVNITAVQGPPLTAMKSPLRTGHVLNGWVKSGTNYLNPIPQATFNSIQLTNVSSLLGQTVLRTQRKIWFVPELICDISI